MFESIEMSLFALSDTVCLSETTVTAGLCRYHVFF